MGNEKVQRVGGQRKWGVSENTRIQNIGRGRVAEM